MSPDELRSRVWPVQLATLVREVEPGAAGRYLYELKFDGYRIVAVLAGGETRLFSRRGQDWTGELPAVATAVARLARLRRRSELAIDGEVCALDPNGVPRFQLLQNRMGEAAPLVYFVFDLLWDDGEDLRSRPIEERRERLARVVAERTGTPVVVASSALSGAPRDLLREACAAGLEGLVAKEKGSTYVGGRRPTWLKIKCTRSQEMAIVGYLPLLGTRRGEVGSLLVALSDGHGGLRYAGKVGTGFTNEMRRKLGAMLEREHVDAPAAEGAPRLGGAARWSRPKHVAEVELTEWTEGGHPRHPSFRGLRPDKTPAECVRERPATPTRRRARPRSSSSRPVSGGERRRGGVEKRALARFWVAGPTPGK